MNTDKLQEQLLEYIKISVEKIGDFTANEIPPFVNEYITWKFYENLLPIGMYALVMLIISVVVYKLIIPLYRWANTTSKLKDDGVYFVTPALATFVLLIITLFAFPYNSIKNCIQIKVAPKVFLIEQASKLITNKD